MTVRRPFARHLPAALVLLAVCVLLAGCSGAGTNVNTLRNATLDDLSAGQMTTVQLLRGWLGVLYAPASTASGSPSLTRKAILDENGNKIGVQFVGTDSNGQPLDISLYYDGHGFGTWHTPDDRELEVSGTWSVPNTVEDRETHVKTTTQDVEHHYPGMTLAWRSTLVQRSEYGTATESQEGTITLPDGRALAFTFYRNAVDLDTLSLRVPSEAISISARVPVAEVANRGWLPLAQGTATGETTVEGRTFGFTLTGVREDWRGLTVEGADGLTGTFTLGDDMAGSGRYEQDGVLQGVLTWTSDLVGHLNLTDLERRELLPNAAASALSLDNWLARVGKLSPSPAF